MDQPSFKLLNIREAAELLGMSTRTLRRLAHGGNIAFVKLPGKKGRVLFSIGEIKRFVEELEDESVSRAADLYDIKSRLEAVSVVA